ncbi:MAG: sigma-70 family RNA polymerase sigma factor [Bacillota bacterium]
MEDQLTVQLRRARAGDERAREQIIGDYASFARAAARRTVGRYVGPDDDLASIALMALDEAIDACDERRLGRGFLSFAEMVIRRRVIDQLRREDRFGKEIPMSSLIDDDELEEPAVLRAESRQRTEMARDADILREEIERLGRELAAFSIEFRELPEVSPRRRDARRRCAKAARDLAADSGAVEGLRRSKKLPLARMDGRVLGRKALERHRRYLIAMVLILSGDYPALSAYLDLGEEERD